VRRRVRLTIGDKTTAGVGALVINDLRVDFEVTKHMGGGINNAVISIYNLAPENRGRIEDIYTTVILEHDNGNGIFSVLYIGEVYNVVHSKAAAVDVITRVFCGSGLNALNNATAHQTIAGGATRREILETLNETLTTFGIDIGTIPTELDAPYSRRGVSISDNIRTILDDVLRGTGVAWSVENQQLEFQRIETAESTGIIVNPANGLIGSTRRTHAGFDFTSIVRPEIRPGVTVDVFSDFGETSQDGLHYLKVRSDTGARVRVLQVVHRGSNFEGNAITDVVGLR